MPKQKHKEADPLGWFKIYILTVVTGGLLLITGYIGYVQQYQAGNVAAKQPSQSPVRTATTATPSKVRPSSTIYRSSILFMGDVMLARTVGQSITKGDTPFKYVQPTLDTYDLRFANIETVIADPAVAVRAGGKAYTFNAPTAAVQTLATAKIDVAGLANNHTNDFGRAALTDMFGRLGTAGIKTVGAGKTAGEAYAPLLVDVPAMPTEGATATGAGSVRVGFIAVNDIENSYTNATATAAGSAFFDEARIAAAIKSARSAGKADLVIVVPHWGNEYQSTPTARQKTWGHFFIDQGADAVIGGHPHVVQPVEMYNGKYIAYSMGNFIFDGMSGSALDGEMIGLHTTLHVKDGVRTVTVDPPTKIPTHIDAQGFPKLR